MRRLIINADDFGLTSGINRSIIEAHLAGTLTSATLMAGAPAFAEATHLAQDHSRLAVGCHVVLVDGEPLLDPARLPSLVPQRTTQFRRRIGQLAARVVTSRIDPDEVEVEAITQFRKLQATGLTITHFDTHKHAHVFPAILGPLLRAARTCGVRALRNPFEPIRPLPAPLLRKRRDLWKRYAQARTLHRLQPAFGKLVAKAGLKTPDGTLGIIVTGVLDQEILSALVENMPDGTWELVCHPGYLDNDLRAVRTRLLESRELERRLLTSSETQRLLEQAEIQLISYNDL